MRSKRRPAILQGSQNQLEQLHANRGQPEYAETVRRKRVKSMRRWMLNKKKINSFNKYTVIFISECHKTRIFQRLWPLWPSVNDEGWCITIVQDAVRQHLRDASITVNKYSPSMMTKSTNYQTLPRRPFVNKSWLNIFNLILSCENSATNK